MSKFGHYAARWHMLNFQGQTLADIARNFNVDEAAVSHTLLFYRALNNFASPQDIAEEKARQRKIGTMLASERRAMTIILDQARRKSSTSIVEVARLLHRSRRETERLMRNLVTKGYIDLCRNRQGGYFALPLLDLNGCVYVGESEAHYEMGKDGVRRYTKPEPCVGYGWRGGFKVKPGMADP